MAMIQKIEKISKTGESVIIRSATIDDALSAYHIQRSVVAENDYVITTPHEFRNSEASYQEMIRKISENPKELFIVVEIKNEVVGWLVFNTASLERRAHIGEFGMMISRDYRGNGLGKLLILAMLDWATEHPIIERIGLEVFSTNEKAIGLYKGLGFMEEGRKIKQIKFGTCAYIDLILMYKFVK